MTDLEAFIVAHLQDELAKLLARNTPYGILSPPQRFPDRVTRQQRRYAERQAGAGQKSRR